MWNPFSALFRRSERKSDPAFAQYGTRITFTGNDAAVYSARNYQYFARDGYSRCIVADRKSVV